jgi:hypothetical protein
MFGTHPNAHKLESQTFEVVDHVDGVVAPAYYVAVFSQSPVSPRVKPDAKHGTLLGGGSYVRVIAATNDIKEAAIVAAMYQTEAALSNTRAFRAGSWVPIFSSNRDITSYWPPDVVWSGDDEGPTRVQFEVDATGATLISTEPYHPHDAVVSALKHNIKTKENGEIIRELLDLGMQYSTVADKDASTASTKLDAVMYPQQSVLRTLVTQQVKLVASKLPTDKDHEDPPELVTDSQGLAKRLFDPQTTIFFADTTNIPVQFAPDVSEKGCRDAGLRDAKAIIGTLATPPTMTESERKEIMARAVTTLKIATDTREDDDEYEIPKGSESHPGIMLPPQAKDRTTFSVENLLQRWVALGLSYSEADHAADRPVVHGIRVLPYAQLPPDRDSPPKPRSDMLQTLKGVVGGCVADMHATFVHSADRWIPVNVGNDSIDDCDVLRYAQAMNTAIPH